MESTSELGRDNRCGIKVRSSVMASTGWNVGSQSREVGLCAIPVRLC